MSFFSDILDALFPRRRKPPVTPPPPPKPLPERESFSYGPDPLQTGDVYRPAGMVEGDTAETIFMVHGGGWDNPDGDKANSGVIDAKVAYYVPKGKIVISINYPLYPQVSPLGEAQSVAQAVAYAQQKVAGVGEVDLMGHSAGAHLVALVATSEPIRKDAGCKPPRKVICLDGIYDVELAIKVGKKTGSDEYAPFGTDPQAWPAESPIDCVAGVTGPFLLCYSTKEGKQRKTQADNFAGRVQQFGGSAEPQGFALEHGEMDSMVGLPGPLTDAVDKFLG